MPVAPEIGCLDGNHHDVTHSGVDWRLTPGAGVRLARLIGLDGMDDLVVRPIHCGRCRCVLR